MHKRNYWSENSTVFKYTKTISEIHYGCIGDNLDNKKTKPTRRWTRVLGEGTAVGINSGKRCQSGCMQGGFRLMDSKRTPNALSLARGLSLSDQLEPLVLNLYATDF